MVNTRKAKSWQAYGRTHQYAVRWTSPTLISYAMTIIDLDKTAPEFGEISVAQAIHCRIGFPLCALDCLIADMCRSISKSRSDPPASSIMRLTRRRPR